MQTNKCLPLHNFFENRIRRFFFIQNYPCANAKHNRIILEKFENQNPGMHINKAIRNVQINGTFHFKSYC